MDDLILSAMPETHPPLVVESMIPDGSVSILPSGFLRPETELPISPKLRWARRLLMKDLPLAALVLRFHVLFDAKVERCDHPDPDCCWPESVDE